MSEDDKVPYTKYVVVTAVQQYRTRYCIPLSELQNENPDVPVDPLWALDAVTCNDVKEFSQLDMGENIVDHCIMSETEILELWDKDNDYLREWPTNQKLNHIFNWKESTE